MLNQPETWHRLVEEKLISHEIHLKQRPVGMPTEDSFQLVKVNIPELKDGEFLVHNIWICKSLYVRPCEGS